MVILLKLAMKQRANWTKRGMDYTCVVRDDEFEREFSQVYSSMYFCLFLVNILFLVWLKYLLFWQMCNVESERTEYFCKEIHSFEQLKYMLVMDMQLMNDTFYLATTPEERVGINSEVLYDTLIPNVGGPDLDNLDTIGAYDDG